VELSPIVRPPLSPAQARLVDWLAAVVRDDEAPLEPLDDELLEAVCSARLEALVSHRGSRDERLRRAAVEAFARTTAVVQASARVCELLRSADVPCVTLKGPALAVRYWGDISLRASRDVDVLVAPDAVPRAREALAAAGFAPVEDYPAWFQRGWHFHLTFRGDAGVPVELHWDLLPRELGRLPVVAIVAEPDEVACESHTLPALSPAWQPLAAAAHAFVHSFPLRELVDMAFVARRLTTAEWLVAVDRAAAAGVGSLLYYGVAASASLLGWEPPVGLSRLRPGAGRDALVRRYLAALPVYEGLSPRMHQVTVVVGPLVAGSPGRWVCGLPRSMTRRPFLARRLDRWAGGGRGPGGRPPPPRPPRDPLQFTETSLTKY